jgi:hypothetical protein
VLDLGTGDGRFVVEQSRKAPKVAVIGVDLCGANFRQLSRKAGGNARFLVADACALPEEMYAVADHINIAFPWGRLLREILDAEGAFLSRLVHTMHPRSTLSILFNADAAHSCDVALPDAQARILSAIAARCGNRPVVTTLDARRLRSWPSTWAKRLAFGRNPHAVAITTCAPAEPMRSPDDLTRLSAHYHAGQYPVAVLRG